MIKVDLITGFLGSGKTTFLLKYGRFLIKQGLKIGILIYDFGAVNVDMVLLGELRGRNCEIEMVSAGCDDDCLKRRFKTKLIAMAMSGYDRVIIEPSGIFDMDMFFDTLREEPLEDWYEIGSVISIADGLMRLDMSEEERAILATETFDSGNVIISKTQLIEAERIEAVKEYILQSGKEMGCDNFRGKFITKVWEQFTDSDFRGFADCGFYVNDFAKGYLVKNISYDSVSMLEIQGGVEEIKRKVNILFSDESYGNITRVKGFISDGPSYEINATREQFDIRQKAGRIVFTIIGSNLNKDKIKELIR